MATKTPEQIERDKARNAAIRTAKELIKNNDNYSALEKVTAVYRFHNTNLGRQNSQDGTLLAPTNLRNSMDWIQP